MKTCARNAGTFAWSLAAMTGLVAAIALGAQPTTSPAAGGAARPTDAVDAYPYVLGTQAIGGAYQFTDAPKLVEAARVVRDMGSNAMKFAMRPQYFGPTGNVPRAHPGVRTLTELARDEPAHRAVLDMPFPHYIVWAYAFTAELPGDAFPPAEAAKEYDEVYALARHLLRTYGGTGKTFYLGNWEGDWGLLGHTDAKRDPAPGRAAAMAEWLRVRQRAVDDARRDTPHANVAVYQYAEVNLVRKESFKNKLRDGSESGLIS